MVIYYNCNVYSREQEYKDLEYKKQDFISCRVKTESYKRDVKMNFQD